MMHTDSGGLRRHPEFLKLWVGPTLVTAVVVGCLPPVLIALAPSRPVEGFAVLVVAQALDLIHPLYDVNALT